MKPGCPTRRLSIWLGVMALTASSCQFVQPAPTTAGPTGTTASSTTTTPPGDPVIFEVGAAATHPNGTQLRLERIELFPDALVVVCSVTNGSLFGIRLDRGRTELTAADGTTVELAEPMNIDEVGPGEDVNLILRFPPLLAAELTLDVNLGGGSSPASPSTSSPTFSIGPFPLDADRIRPPLPDAALLDRTLVHPNGTELQVRAIGFTANRIGIQIRASNPGSAGVVLAARTIAPSLLVDDLGNRYPIMVDSDEGALTVPAGSARAGVLSFAGRIHPDATNVTLLLNQLSDPSTEGRGARYPRLRVDTLPIEGERPVSLPQPVADPTGVEHPNGVRVEPFGIRFGSSAIETDVTITNPGTSPVELAATSTVVQDDAGNRYPLVTPAGNPNLAVEAGAVVEATLVFTGRISRDATQIILQFNQGRSAEDPETSEPALNLGPYDLIRPEPAGLPSEPEVFVISTVSRLFEDTIVASDVEQIAQTLIQFNATRTDEGVLLTLPDDILFDFASAELRDDARQALGLIAEVLEYFEGDPVTVVGHTDSIGSDQANLSLSEERAQAVATALISEHGVDPNRLTAEGRGESEPIAPNTTPEGEDDPEGRQKNRRVEILVVTDRPLPNE